MSAQNMGKSLIRAKKKRQLANRANFQAILEQEQRQHVSQETAPKLKSVWQTSNLEDVLTAADQRLEGYTANRDVRVVVSGAVHVVTGDKLRPETELVTKEWHLLSAKLPIPERPRWTFKMSAADVEAQEKAAFVEWRRELARIEEADKIVMTPYEKNVEVWRQLWRVVERSDIVLEIVDARNPLAFRSEGLERYVAKHNTKAGTPKQCVLLLNKADLLTVAQRKHWADYFTARKIKFFFFSARASTEAAALAAKGEMHLDPARDSLAAQLEDAEAEREDERRNENGDDDDESSDANEDAQPGTRRATSGRENSGPMLEEEKYEAAALKQIRADAAKAPERKERRRKDRRTGGAPTVVANPYAVPQLREAAERRRLEKEAEAKKEKPLTAQEIERDRRMAQLLQDRIKAWDVLDPTTLLDALAVMRAELGVVGSESIMVGMTGYPNVGKSSTINAIMACKKVVVSATPGKTKHFQTLPIPNERRLALCDCPGLVFPSFSSTKEAMVCDGVLPVDTCRDYVAAVSLVCRRIPRPVLEKQYLVVLEKEYDVDESSSHAELLLNTLARRKGYMTEHDKPNRYRSAHIILKEYVDGKLLYVHPPPGLELLDSNPPVSQPKKASAPPAVAAPEANDDDDDDEEAWETDDEDDADWEDVSDADEARQLSDGEESVASEEEPDPLSFWAVTNYNALRPLVTAELFNLEHNTQIVTHEEKVFKRYKKKINHMLVPDDGPGSYRVNHKGQKELIIDDDDDIEICDEVEVKEKKPSKRTQRRKAKQGLLALKGAKPAAHHSLYSLSAEAQGTNDLA